MRIVLATDAWEPQVNGVVRTLTRTVAECRAMGHEVEVIEPSQFKTIPAPTYPEIKLALGAEEEIRERLRAIDQYYQKQIEKRKRSPFNCPNSAQCSTVAC